MSVSTLATRHQSPLSQNDRKIIMVEHFDNTISIHIFIGAVGVNNVSIYAPNSELNQGTPVGAMGFGDDAEGRNHWHTTSTTKDSIRLRADQKPLILGRNLGGFTKNGSTVVSLYIGFHPSKRMNAAKLLKYTDSQGIERQIEIQAQMGNVIGEIVSRKRTQI